MATPALGRIDQRTYLYILLAQALIVLALESGTLAFAQTHEDLMKSQPLRAIICHFIFLAVMHLSQVALTLEAIWTNHAVQIYWTVIMQLLLLPISIVQIYETRDAIHTALCGAEPSCARYDDWWNVIRPMQVTIPILQGLILPLQLGCGVIVGQHLGSDWAYIARSSLQEFMTNYAIFLIFSKFSFITIIPITIQLFVLGYHNGAVLQGLSIAGMAVTVVIVVSGHVATTYEWKWLSYTMFSLLPISEAYLLWRFAEFYIPRSKHLYYNTRVSLTLQMLLALLLQAEVFWLGLVAKSDYGQPGLKDAKLKKPNPQTKRAWRVGQTPKQATNTFKKPPGTEFHLQYYTQGEEMKERASIV